MIYWLDVIMIEKEAVGSGSDVWGEFWMMCLWENEVWWLELASYTARLFVLNLFGCSACHLTGWVTCILLLSGLDVSWNSLFLSAEVTCSAGELTCSPSCCTLKYNKLGAVSQLHSNNWLSILGNKISELGVVSSFTLLSSLYLSYCIPVIDLSFYVLFIWGN